MTKEKAIMELISIARQSEAIEAAVAALGDWTELQELITPLQEKENELLNRMDELTDIVNGEKMNLDKAF